MPGIPIHLTDPQLIDALKRCVRDERGATAVLIAHLAEMDARRLHFGFGFSSLFEYCCDELGLSEDATCNRIEVARAARRFPVLLDRLADGSLSLSAAKALSSKLTDENHLELMAAAARLRRRAVEEMLARRFPKADVPTLVRKLPTKTPPVTIETSAGSTSAEGATTSIGGASNTLPSLGSAPPLPSPRQRLATPLSADRYQIRFTASAATWKKLRVARDLLRHAVPSGDAGEIFDRALTALIGDLARKKCGAVPRPAQRGRGTAPSSRHVPAKVRRAVWARDQGRCAFVAASGRRCQERGRLEFHHVEPYAVGGVATVANIQLRCRAHNAYEAVLFYGTDGLANVAGEPRATYGSSARDSIRPGTDPLVRSTTTLLRRLTGGPPRP